MIFFVLFVSRQKEQIGIWGRAPLSNQKKVSRGIRGRSPLEVKGVKPPLEHGSAKPHKLKKLLTNLK
ncbi:MAG: hypothetical protein AMS27_07515 [Bacteroides sp. SM23_62_1]|nr:MAG: hypothetical protein AMS27_07515 [Bacteroides sp. SM23_62_1]